VISPIGQHFYLEVNTLPPDYYLVIGTYHSMQSYL